MSEDSNPVAEQVAATERDAETGQERLTVGGGANDKMRDILESRKAPAVISRRSNRPRPLVSRNGVIYDKRTGDRA